MSSLPPELIDRVLDFLHNDPATLRACALVNRFWLPTARLHLLQHEALCEIIPSRLGSFIRLLLAPCATFPRYMTHLTLNGAAKYKHESILDADTGMDFDRAYPALLTGLPNLTSLIFARWKTLGAHPLHLFLPHCTALRRLRLEAVNFSSSAELFHVLSLLPPGLEVLEVWWSTWGSPMVIDLLPVAAAEVPGLSLSSGLKRISLRRSGIRDVLGALQRGGGARNSEILELELELIGLLSEDCATVGEFMQQAGAALTHLTVEFSQTVPPWMDYSKEIPVQWDATAHEFLSTVDLRHNTSLRTVRLNTIALDTGSQTHAIPTQILCAILASLTSPALRLIVFTLSLHSDADIHNPTIFDWEQIDGVLSGLAANPEVRILLDAYDEARRTNIERAVLEKMPRLAGRVN